MANTTTITINMDKDVVNKLKKLAASQKQKKGFLGKTITMATNEYIKKGEQEEIRVRQLRKLEKGYKMGKILIKHRSELYDRH